MYVQWSCMINKMKGASLPNNAVRTCCSNYKLLVAPGHHSQVKNPGFWVGIFHFMLPGFLCFLTKITKLKISQTFIAKINISHICWLFINIICIITVYLKLHSYSPDHDLSSTSSTEDQLPVLWGILGTGTWLAHCQTAYTGDVTCQGVAYF